MKYCIALGEKPVDRKSEDISDVSVLMKSDFPFPLLRNSENIPVVSEDAKELKCVCKAYQRRFPNRHLSIRLFFGSSRVYEMPSYGRYKIGKDSVEEFPKRFKSGHYSATFEIEHGVSTGLLVKYDEKSTATESFKASTDTGAYKRAHARATKLAEDYLSTTKRKTSVTISIEGPDGKELDQKNIVRKLFLDRFPVPNLNDLEETIESELPNGKTIISVSAIEHLLALAK